MSPTEYIVVACPRMCPEYKPPENDDFTKPCWQLVTIIEESTNLLYIWKR